MLFHLTPSPDSDRLIGMGAHMERMQLLLRLDLDEVRMIGIWGQAGIGKSTIARFLFNQLSNSFQLSAIMVNTKGSYPKPCLDEGSAQLQLQNQMLSQMINHEDVMITHLGAAEERLKDKNVLLVLDDVDRLAQLDALARKVQWFGPRSRIIITTEDLKLLKAHGINHIYKVAFPSTTEALEMFCMYAFDQKSPKDGFMELSLQITYLAGNLPLGLKVMGSYFRGMSKEEWTRVLPRLRNRLDGEIESILKFSYDDLCDEDKDLFLHIACFFNHGVIKKVEEHLANKFLNVRQGLHVLAEKSLISTTSDKIEMHNLLAQLGKEIVRKQYDGEPGKRQFLVDDKDIYKVFTDPTTITRSLIGMYGGYNLNWEELNTSDRVFERMYNLQFLRFKEFLVELSMPNSKLETLWEGIKVLRNLKWMDLSCSINLKEIPNLSTAINLQELNLKVAMKIETSRYETENDSAGMNKAAKQAGKVPDVFYCLKLLEATGISTVSGSGFGQKEGVFHLRTTILRAEEEMPEIMESFKKFNDEFMSQYGDNSGYSRM
ncbi:hypothetical protein AALP_AA2G135300 [Arabis alpina]|uniref:Uncharacterized protein n=1 Tax=Arabis alpina TaxID=50452 RepID=A0A087HH70_ARAAL|nr:hypothetical protein AALP_AA2G135300 [Arabis alpina]